MHDLVRKPVIIENISDVHTAFVFVLGDHSSVRPSNLLSTVVSRFTHVFMVGVGLCVLVQRYWERLERRLRSLVRLVSEPVSGSARRVLVDLEFFIISGYSLTSSPALSR